MNRIIRAALQPVAAITILVFLSACASTSTQKSTGEFADDAAITAKVKTALTDSPDVKARQVNVETYRGEVQLNGFVDTSAAKTAATRVASAVSGVREVHNNLEVADKTSSPAEAADDAMLTAKVKTALIADPITKAHQIDVKTEAGVVQLAGFVDSSTEKAKATEVARSVSGVKAVRNEIELKPAP